MPGLPFADLLDQNRGLYPSDTAALMVNPEESDTADERRLIEKQNATVRQNIAEQRADALGPGPRRPYVEIMPTQRTMSPANIQDPSEYLQAQIKTKLDAGLGQLTAQRNIIQQSIAYDQQQMQQEAKLDAQAIQDDPDLTADEKAKKLRAKQLEYQKKELALNSKIRPDLDRIAAQEQELRGTAAMDLAVRQRDIAQAQWQADQGIISSADAAYLKARAAGQNVTREMFQPARTRTAMQEWRDTTAIYDRWRNILSKFRQVEVPGELSWGQWAGNKAWFGQPFKAPSVGTSWRAYNPSTKKYDLDVPAGVSDYLTQIQTQAQETYPRLLELEKQALGRRRLATAVEGTPGPVAQIVQQARTEQPEKVKVRRPDGKLGLIRREQLTEALANGYTQVK